MNKDDLMNYPLHMAWGAVSHDWFFKTDKDGILHDGIFGERQNQRNANR